jgi:hypothetical protein
MNLIPRLNNFWLKIIRDITLSVLLFLITGCKSDTITPIPSEVIHFVPPASNPAQEQIERSAPTLLPTRQANCLNQLEFLEDLTIPDGTEVFPGDKIIKRWLIKNTGSCNWNSTYSLQLISGLALGAEKVQGLYPARQSTDAVLEITFNAPDNPGRYNSWWQAYDPDGNRFGDPFYVEISVVEEFSEDG